LKLRDIRMINKISNIVTYQGLAAKKLVHP
jgi:hypothetical protein